MFFDFRRARTSRTPKASTCCSRFTARVERLEAGDVPAASLSLAAGVLTINGTSGNDSIVLHQSGGRVSVTGVSTTYASTAVHSIVVNAAAGNDTVSLSGLKAQPWSKPV